MPLETYTLVVEVIDQARGVGVIVAGPKEKEKFTNKFLEEHPIGTLLEFDMLKTGKSVQVTDFRVHNSVVVNDNNQAEWIKIGTEWFAPDDVKLFDVAQTIAQEEGVFNLLIKGLSGYGKTSRAKAYAEANGYNYVRINCALFRDPEEIFMYRSAEGGSLVNHFSEFATAVMEGNTIVVLDELNRAESWILNSLFPLLDWERCTSVLNQEIEVGPNTIFVATINEGYQYSGTFQLDEALANRFGATVEVKEPPAEVEVEIVRTKCNLNEGAEEVVNAVRAMRYGVSSSGADVSTRSALSVGNLFAHGITLKDALRAVIVNKAHKTARKDLLDIINTEVPND